MTRKWWLLVSLLWNSFSVYAQADSSRLAFIEPDTLETKKIRKLDPRKALFYSAVLPGMGQAYNGKYWKIPLVYGGFVGFILVVDFYQKNYIKFRNDLFTLIASGASTSPLGFSEDRLRFAVDQTRRERDQFLVYTGLFYLLQIVDAHVDAHLQDFKFIKESKLSLRPSVQNAYAAGPSAGLTLTFKF